MKEQTEINRGYLDHMRSMSRAQIPVEAPKDLTRLTLGWRLVASGSRALPQGVKRGLKPIWLATLSLPGLSAIRQAVGSAVTSLVLVVSSVTLIVWLKLYLRLKGSRIDDPNLCAIEHVSKFVEQYPFHLYPIVCKAFEFAFLENKIAELLREEARFLEVAIGEGTFSARIFPANARVVGLDLSPYSLRKARQMPHLKQAIVCDCLRPPIGGGYFDVILANNFLHHVTQKEQTLANWSRVAGKVLFNENTPYWASSWPAPYLLRRLGFNKAAARTANQIERTAIQCLKRKEVLDAAVLKEYEIVESTSYMSERTFFLCAIFSFIMRCMGPPTPPHLKHWFLNTPLRRIALPLTDCLAKLLIRFDQFQDRASDAFVSYLCQSRHSSLGRHDLYLLCPQCDRELSLSDQCKECGQTYSSMDGMLFLLQEKLDHIRRDYDPETAVSLPNEHL